ncbi:hypothetical protein QBC37DRAFT_57428 [Rhypophila decipiens]|uniref:Uncharacterized protein n=1 Tax=Rhypophila decipiens TaxID=261697 RepID=A0AAN6YFQ4_9PEZI|nr:hypothetical protein QBC37DRAFT_57428 [Rhypophila decipiens]
MSPSISSILTAHKLPLLLHVIIETAAAFTFIFKPSRQLPPSLSSANPDKTSSPPSQTSCAAQTQTQSSSYDSHLSRRFIPSSPSPPPSSDGIATPTNETDVDDGKTKSEATTARKEVDLILLNYGGLLLTSNLISLVFLARPVFDDLAGLVSLCMASYHVWPAWRALTRMRLYAAAVERNAGGTGNQKFLGGPALHLVIHLGLLGGLVWAGVSV